MKKLFALLVVAGMVFISCGNKTEEVVADDATAQEEVVVEETAPAAEETVVVEETAPAAEETVVAE